MSQSPLYSVIIPVFNKAPYLSQCVESVVQSLSNFEIILINDGSTDNSLFVCTQLQKVFPNIIVIDQTNNGQSYSRNKGMKCAKGEYIIFVDADDYWVSNQFAKIEHGILNLKKSPDIVIFDMVYFDEIKKEFSEISKMKGAEGTLDFNSGLEFAVHYFKRNHHFEISPCRFIIRRESVVNNSLYFKENMYYEDAIWVYELLFKSKSTTYVPADLYVYRKNVPNQITSRINKKKLLDKLCVSSYWHNAMETMIQDKPTQEKFLRITAQLYFDALISYRDLKDADDRDEVYAAIMKNRELLKYPYRVSARALSYASKAVGVRFSSFVFYQLYRIKSSFSKRL